MACKHDASLRIVVSGITKRIVRRDAEGIAEERDLGSFFRDVGCKVAEVRLVMDANRRNKPRGLAFLDFEDPESLELALTLHNKEAQGLADKNGKLRIAKAHEGKDRHQELSDARNQTEEMERKFAFHRAKLNELVREMIQQQHNVGAAQVSGTFAALPLAAFEPLACKRPAHKDAAESTANGQGRVAIEADHLRAGLAEFWVTETLRLPWTRSAPPVISVGSPAGGTASFPAETSPPYVGKQTSDHRITPAAKGDDEPGTGID